MTNIVYIRTRPSGYQHPKCYLSFTNGCSTKITGEHYISHNLLKKIARVNKTIDIMGLHWLPTDQLISIGKNSLVSNVLCSDHNSALSPLDESIGQFVEAISSIDAEHVKKESAALSFQVDGANIERWLIKTILGLVHSGQIRQKSGDPFVIHPKCLELLCVPHARWPTGWGLYLATSPSAMYHSSSFEFIPKHNPENGLLLELELKFNGMQMHFLMGKPDNPAYFGVHRPQSIVFRKGSTLSEIQFSWPRRKANPRVVLTYAGTYTGTSPDHSSITKPQVAPSAQK